MRILKQFKPFLYVDIESYTIALLNTKSVRKKNHLLLNSIMLINNHLVHILAKIQSVKNTKAGEGKIRTPPVPGYICPLHGQEQWIF